MDISYWSEQLANNARYVDVDGVSKDLLVLLKNHGINFIRLRTFVDPKAAYGYASTGNGCTGKTQAFGGKDDIVRTAQRIKAAGMGFLLDFHYSDTWADPGKQIIPEAWRSARTIDQLAVEVQRYTTGVLESLRAVNALPNMVQVGNEITPGMLIHTPATNTDCWGNNSAVNSGLNGQANNANWVNLARLLRAGIQAVKQVDANILTVLHIENTDSPSDVEWWVDSALQQKLEFDVLGFSAYAAFQGPAANWPSNFQRFATRYPKLSFVVAEYNPEAKLLNKSMRDLPSKRGLGTFLWEPTETGSWGQALFTRSGNTYTAIPARFQEYDALRREYGL
jgi:arabinogalactan endo-1,4-beta-galactosidase